MTEQEALALKPGDRVAAKISGKWRLSVVLEGTWRDYYRGVVRVPVRRVGLTKAGWPFYDLMRTHFELRPSRTNVTPQIYADWLFENGFVEASEALRKKFPLVED